MYLKLKDVNLEHRINKTMYLKLKDVNLEHRINKTNWNLFIYLII